MAKNTAEWSNRLSVFFLKKHGYLPQEHNYSSGEITWTHGLSGNKSSIGFTVVINAGDAINRDDYIKLSYTHTSNYSGEKESMDYKIPLTTTPCNYGGVRYWLVCPLIKNGQYCGKRVGVLYSVGKYFGCRHCGEIAYAAQMKGGTFRGSSVSIPDIERAEKEIKRYYYRGKPTRKYRRVMKMRDKIDRDFIGLAARLDKRFGRFAPSKK